MNAGNVFARFNVLLADENAVGLSKTFKLEKTKPITYPHDLQTLELRGRSVRLLAYLNRERVVLKLDNVVCVSFER